jgi:hypothetical protein
MQSFLDYWQNLWAGYPDWLGFVVLAVFGVLGLWVAAKLIVLCFKFVLISAVLCMVIGGVIYFLG